MSTKRQVASPKETWKATRARYTWHLRPPFKDEFDHSHWWEDHADVNEIAPVGVLYELARRHPLVGEVRSKFRHAKWYGQELRAPLVGAAEERMVSHAFNDLGQEPPPIYCLCLIGLRSWPTLEGKWQEYWEDSAGIIKGIDCRPDFEKCDLITFSAWTDVLLKRARMHKSNARGMTNKKFTKLVAEDFVKNSPPAQDFETAVIQKALAAHRQGLLLLAIAPDLPNKDAALLLAETYGRQSPFNPPERRGTWWKKWMQRISELEDDVLHRPSNQKVNPQIFVHYRRAMDGIRFENPRPPDVLPTHSTSAGVIPAQIPKHDRQGKTEKPKLPISPTN